MIFDNNILYTLEEYIGELLDGVDTEIEIVVFGLNLYRLFDHFIEAINNTAVLFWLNRFPISIIYNITSYLKPNKKRSQYKTKLINKSIQKILNLLNTEGANISKYITFKVCDCCDATQSVESLLNTKN